MKRQLFIIALLLMPISITYLHAQENKHAQAMYKAFVETRNGKFPKEITAQWKAEKDDSASVFWTALDGGGLVPKNKINVVQLAKNRAVIGPYYLDGWRFEFRNVPDDSTLPLMLSTSRRLMPPAITAMWLATSRPPFRVSVSPMAKVARLFRSRFTQR